MTEAMSIREAIERGLSRIRQPQWSGLDHLELVRGEDGVTPWATLWALDGGTNQRPVLLALLDQDERAWLPHLLAEEAQEQADRNGAPCWLVRVRINSALVKPSYTFFAPGSPQAEQLKLEYLTGPIHPRESRGAGRPGR